MIDSRAEIKYVGVNGQICLGKKYSGRQVQISELEDGSLIIKTGIFIPDSEKWLYRDNNLQKLNMALNWAERHPRSDNFAEIEQRILNNE